jgi:very-short-patch-repair endonuclease
MNYHEVDRQLERLAKRQHYVFTRDQALAARATDAVVRHRVRIGAWVRLAPAVYALASGLPTFERQCMAACLGSPGSAVAGRAAARLQQLTGFPVVRPELVVPYGASTRSRLATVHRSRDPTTTIVDHIPVTTIAQTICDLAGRVPPWTLERAVDDAILTGRLAVTELEERVIAYAGARRRGLALFRALTAERGDAAWEPPESELEAVLWRVLERVPGQPKLVRQPALPWRTRTRQRVDVLLPDFHIIVEADGRRWHSRFGDFDRDTWRRNAAIAHGYLPLHFTWAHLTLSPRDVMAIVEATIARVQRRRAYREAS